MMYYDDRNGGHWGWMLVSMVISIVFLAALIWIIARLAIDSQRRENRSVAPPESEALALLQRRYASGELDDAEYEHRRQVLLGKP